MLYTLYVPSRDNDHREIPHVLSEARQMLTNLGLPNRSVHRKVQGDWQGNKDYYETEENDLIVIDADQSALDRVRQVAEYVKQAANQEAIYLTAAPITTYLI